MRRWMLVFGVLDLGIVATHALRVTSYLRGLSFQPMLNTACLVLLASLIVSGVALLGGHRWGFTLNYFQFPARLALGFLSFSWLAMLILPSQPSIMLNQAVWGTAIALEGIRLGITIMLHASHPGQQHNQPLQRTIPA
jgi:hypothetical protein